MYDQLVTIELDPLVLGLHQDNDVAAQVNHPVPHVASRCIFPMTDSCGPWILFKSL